MTIRHLPLLILALAFAAPVSVQAQDDEPWLPTLITDTPEEGFALAVTLARKGVTVTQPDKEILMTLRPHYARDAGSLTAASQVVAIHFQTIAAANNYWRSD